MKLIAWFNYVLVNLFHTLFRMLPFPCKTGLIEIGNPRSESPVFLTGNYHLTVKRVRRALMQSKLNAYLLVANSRGVNVWCSSVGGLFTNHDVISALKLSRVGKRVSHRQVVLPQLAAPGIEAKFIEKRTGWKVIWGPVYAKDIPAFIKNNFKKTFKMREVQFSWLHRLEMAVAWAFPISIFLSLATFFLWRSAFWTVIALVWSISFLIFLTFPLYSRWFNPQAKRVGVVFFDFGRGGIHLILWLLLIALLVFYSQLSGNLSWRFVLRWSFMLFVIVLLVSIDIAGSTPVRKGSLLEDRYLKVVLDEEKCQGVGYCVEVCPRNCYELDKSRHLAMVSRPEECVKCGACVVQCPYDALYFENPKGKVILPKVVRQYKTNLIGKRLVKVE
jgi:NAD-dependent dihydropyrimidine dehydrogenase PreA subunit